MTDGQVLALFKKIMPTSSNVNVIEKVTLKNIKNSKIDRPEFRVRDGDLKSVLFRKADKTRKVTKYVGKRHPQYKYFKKAWQLGITRSRKIMKKGN